MERNGENDVFTKAEVEAIAVTAAEHALASLFEKLDIDVNSKESMRKFRDNLTFLDDQRAGSIALKQNIKKSMLYVSGTALLGLMYFLWDALKDGLHMWLVNLK
jgi:hypothetical protein